MSEVRREPNLFEQHLLAENRALAPRHGGAFHDSEDLQAFLDTPRELYTPCGFVIDRICSLDAVVVVGGPAGVGKNGAIEQAVIQSQYPRPRHNVADIHPVLNGTTRLPEFRDGAVEEDGVHYDFAFAAARNRRLGQQLREGMLVQYAQPRGDHVYFTDTDGFPKEGIAIMDAVPVTVMDLNRILEQRGKRTTAIYRTDVFDTWMSRWLGRGDGSGSAKEQQANIAKRLKEAASSITEILDLRSTLDVQFFSVEERKEAGKTVIDIVTGHHDPEMQQLGIRNAQDMLNGLADLGHKAS